MGLSATSVLNYRLESFLQSCQPGFQILPDFQTEHSWISAFPHYVSFETSDQVSWTKPRGWRLLSQPRASWGLVSPCSSRCISTGLSAVHLITRLWTVGAGVTALCMTETRDRSTMRSHFCGSSSISVIRQRWTIHSEYKTEETFTKRAIYSDVGCCWWRATRTSRINRQGGNRNWDQTGQQGEGPERTVAFGRDTILKALESILYSD